ncbi:MAG: alpha/beta hydrolase [Myxococcota bacterium]
MERPQIHAHHLRERHMRSGRVLSGLLIGGLFLSSAGMTADASAQGVKKPKTTAPEKKVTLLPSGTVSIPGEGGLLQNGVYMAGKEKGSAVIFLHMDGRSLEDWRAFAERLQRSGVHVLLLDLRGHGGSTKFSGGKSLTYEQLEPAQYELMIKDVAAAVVFLRARANINPESVALVGASVGANIAARVAADDPRIANLVLLSPGLEYKGIAIEDAVQRYAERPLFLAVSREDNFSAKSSLVLDSVARGKKALRVYTGAGHGTRMLAKESSLEPQITNWLGGNYDVDGDDIITPGEMRP